MKKNGFIATSILYSFFIVFISMFMALITNYLTNKVAIDRLNTEVKENLKLTNETKLTDLMPGDYVEFDLSGSAADVLQNESNNTNLYWIVSHVDIGENTSTIKLVSSPLNVYYTGYKFDIDGGGVVSSRFYHSGVAGMYLALNYYAKVYDMDNATPTLLLESPINGCTTENCSSKIDFLQMSTIEDIKSDLAIGYIYEEVADSLINTDSDYIVEQGCDGEEKNDSSYKVKFKSSNENVSLALQKVRIYKDGEEVSSKLFNTYPDTYSVTDDLNLQNIRKDTTNMFTVSNNTKILNFNTKQISTWIDSKLLSFVPDSNHNKVVLTTLEGETDNSTKAAKRMNVYFSFDFDSSDITSCYNNTCYLKLLYDEGNTDKTCFYSTKKRKNYCNSDGYDIYIPVKIESLEPFDINFYCDSEMPNSNYTSNADILGLGQSGSSQDIINSVKNANNIKYNYGFYLYRKYKLSATTSDIATKLKRYCGVDVETVGISKKEPNLVDLFSKYKSNILSYLSNKNNNNYYFYSTYLSLSTTSEQHRTYVDYCYYSNPYPYNYSCFNSKSGSGCDCENYTCSDDYIVSEGSLKDYAKDTYTSYGDYKYKPYVTTDDYTDNIRLEMEITVNNDSNNIYFANGEGHYNNKYYFTDGGIPE